MKGKHEIGILVFILFVGFLFRVLFFESSFYFAHDQDLYSWIAKDIIGGHQRLVGQLTSVDGVFIGSFYYYLMALTYILFGMNPISAIVPLTIIGLLSIWSIYWVGKSFFGVKTGLISGFIYAISFGVASFDRWSVPTQPTMIWSIWFGATILGLYKGNLKYLPLYGFLVGFVWQLHIALLPILPIPILAYFLGKNNFRKLIDFRYVKWSILGVVVFSIMMTPFLLFEFKHDFSQVRAIAAGISQDTGGVSGWQKVVKLFETSGREFQKRLWLGDFEKGVAIYWMILIVVLMGLIVNGFDKKILGLFMLWYGMIMLAQFVSKRVVSEYYFTNFIPIYILLIANFIPSFVNSKWLLAAGLVYGLINVSWLVNKSEYDQSYVYRKQVVEYIKADSEKENYPCIAVNFIADPGVGVGFRYLFWYNNISLVKPGTKGVPVYNIPIPWQLSRDENPVHFGRFGVLLPVKTESLITKNECGLKENQLEALLGYTD